MAQHGYLGDGFGTHGYIDPNRDDDRDQNRNRQRDNDRDRGDQSGFMLDRGDDRRQHGFADYRDDETRSRFADEQRQSARYPEQRGRASRPQGRASSNPDDHYRSWRDWHMAEVDQDYQDYCRECERQFHSEFENWRRNRHSNSREQELMLGEGEPDLTQGTTTDPANAPQATVDPDSAATLGSTGTPVKGRG